MILRKWRKGISNRGKLVQKRFQMFLVMEFILYESDRCGGFIGGKTAAISLKET